MRRRSDLALALALALVGLASACKKKDDRPEDVPVPPRNAATLDVVNTELGTGLALRVGLAPTSVKWERVVSLDDERALLLGREGDLAYALRTSDRGRTWSSVSAQVKPWAAWAIASTGAVALVSGAAERAKAGAPNKPMPVGDVTWWYAAPGDRNLDGPRALLPGEGKLAGVALAAAVGAPAFAGEAMSLLADRGGKTPVLVHAAVTGAARLDAMDLDKQTFAPMPYGRPAKLLSVTKGAVELRSWPLPGDPLGAASAVPNLRAEATTLAQLTEGPSCEAGAFSYRRLAGPQPALLGVSGDLTLAYKLPASDVARLGCHMDAIVTETSVIDPADPEKKRKVPQLVRCEHDGKCSSPKAPPFAVWPEKHDREIWTVPTSRGLVAVMRARTSTRWGLYLGQSNDGGNTFELPRTIGEGADSRGELGFGALLRFQSRLVLLLSADVGATGRRGWYALASDDEGNNWGPP